MLFVCKYAKHRHVINGGTMRWVKDSAGNDSQIDNGDFFWAEFVTGGLDTHDQALAIQEFTRINPSHPFGAEPLMIDGTINQMDAASEGETSNTHEAYFPYQRLSRFDTEDGRMCPERWREATEKVLLESTEYGRDIIRIDILDLVPPWPTYDTMDEAEIVPFALTGGYDIKYVLRYEKATRRSPVIGRDLTKALREHEAREAEKAALTASA